jgi:hypothetical protein
LAEDYPLVMADQRIADSFSDVVNGCTHGLADNSCTGAGR